MEIFHAKQNNQSKRIYLKATHEWVKDSRTTIGTTPSTTWLSLQWLWHSCISAKISASIDALLLTNLMILCIIALEVV